MGCHFLFQCKKVKSESEVAQSCLTFSEPMDCSLPGSSIHGIFQASVVFENSLLESAKKAPVQISYRLHLQSFTRRANLGEMQLLPAKPPEHASVPMKQPRCDSSSSESCLCLSYLQCKQQLGYSFGRPPTICLGKSTALDVVSMQDLRPLRHRRFCTVASGLFFLASHHKKKPPLLLN